MLGVKVWRRLLGVCDGTVIERVDFDEEANAVVAQVRPRRSSKRRCGRCGRRSPGYDQGEGRRRWRALDLGEGRSFLEADAPRVNCPAHGPTVVQLPWARHGAGHTRAFDDTVAWLAVHTSKTAIVELARIAWPTVGAIVARVVEEARAAVDPFDGLVRIGIDEISFKRGHRYLTVVVDHDTGRLVWAAKGHDKRTHPRLRRGRPPVAQEPRRHRGRPGPWAFERPRRVDQHQAAPAHPHRLRLQGTRAPDCPRPARSRRLLPAPSRSLSPVIDPRKGAESPKTLP